MFVDIDSTPKSLKKTSKTEDQIILQKELLFCSSQKEKINFLKDSFGYFRACSIPLMNILFGNSKEKIKNQKIINKRFPRASLKLKRVYGFTAFDRRNTVLYGHHIKNLKINSLKLLKYIQNPGILISNFLISSSLI